MKNKYLILCLIISIVIASCKKDFLDVPVTRTQIAENYITSLSRAEELLNGLYYKLATEVYDYESATHADVIADNTKIDGSLHFPHYSWNQMANTSSSSSNNLNNLWMESYNAVRYCNFILEKIDGFYSEDPVRADAIKGQALGLRALLHINLVNVFAQPYAFTVDASHPGIPYDTTYHQSQQVTRESVKNVYAHLISDLGRAIQLIPASVTNKSSFNRNAAIALLARVFLFKGDFSNAKTFALQITAAVPLMTSANYPSKLFTPNDNESLFWLPPIQASATTLFPGYIYSVPSSNRFFATNDIVNIIKERPLDLRNAWFKDTLSNKMVKKFPIGIVAGFSNPRASQYYTIIRSSEMFLTVAEAAAKTGDENTARTFLDAIRKRADQTAANSTASGTALLDAIYKERRKELCFEGIRMFDLLRTGKGVNRIDVISPADAILPYPSDKAISPIPEQDVQFYSLQQNIGY